MRAVAYCRQSAARADWAGVPDGGTSGWAAPRQSHPAQRTGAPRVLESAGELLTFMLAGLSRTCDSAYNATGSRANRAWRSSINDYLQRFLRVPPGILTNTCTNSQAMITSQIVP